MEINYVVLVKYLCILSGSELDSSVVLFCSDAISELE